MSIIISINIQQSNHYPAIKTYKIPGVFASENPTYWHAGLPVILRTI
ncbi:MAG: hypothetical protein Q8904_00120 [Bacteroidota bacterium]|nr:hypothetical protein [Bacteroidota bacterium]